MHERDLPGRLILVAALVAAAGCAPPHPHRRYLEERAFRRAALEASLAARDNQYAQARLAHYATGAAGDWEARPAWNPPVAAPGEPTARPLTVEPAARRGDARALLALGREAFFRYPAQLAPWASPATVPGLVRVTLGDGGEGWALTCATCHVREAPDGAGLVGAGNDRLDLGRRMVEGDPAMPPELAAARLAWGPGRVDVTTAEGDDPLRIPDLRPIRWQRHLHHAASVTHDGAVALAIRIETLLVTAYGAALRPPREVALGLALYLEGLADALPARSPRSDEERRGEALFARACAGCHQGPAMSGPPVPAAQAHGDGRHAARPERGTGSYRVPSLRGVTSRGPLLHDGSAADLDALLAELPPADRRAIAAYLATR